MSDFCLTSPTPPKIGHNLCTFPKSNFHKKVRNQIWILELGLPSKESTKLQICIHLKQLDCLKNLASKSFLSQLCEMIISNINCEIVCTHKFQDSTVDQLIDPAIQIS